jgi:hypothetical protein
MKNYHNRPEFSLQQCCRCFFWFFTAKPEPFICSECESHRQEAK